MTALFPAPSAGPGQIPGLADQQVGGANVHELRLAAEASYKTALAGQPDKVSSILFGDFSQLLSLGEQTGLTSSTRVRELLGDLAKVHTVGLSSSSGESDTTTELRLEIP